MQVAFCNKNNGSCGRSYGKGSLYQLSAKHCFFRVSMSTSEPAKIMERQDRCFKSINVHEPLMKKLMARSLAWLICWLHDAGMLRNKSCLTESRALPAPTSS